MGTTGENPITPNTQIRLTIGKALALAAAIISGGAMIANGYYELKASILQMDFRITAMAAVVSKADPAAVKDTCKEIVAKELADLVVECPKNVRKGETVLGCKPVLRRYKGD